MTTVLASDTSRTISRFLIDKYFRTTPYPYTQHHINSYNQFIGKDLVSIIQANNPILILKDLIDDKDSTYRYKIEIYVGGEEGTDIEIGTPTLSLQNGKEVRILFPNEARLRNLTYASSVYARLVVKIQYTELEGGIKKMKVLDIPPDTFRRFEIFKIPIMLHSRYCILHKKPKEFLYQAGECPYDNGGYFVIEGAEKVLITRQEQSFNTLYVNEQPRDPKVRVYATIVCLNQASRQTKRVSFALMRREESIQVQLPFVRKAIPIFVLFRALGFQSDEEIMQMIFPDFVSGEDKPIYNKLQPSILDSFPFLNTNLAVEYIRTLTKGFGTAHVIDIIRNQLFTHMPNDQISQALFLGDCVRKILFVNVGFDNPTDKDDTRNQRCLVSGFLVQELFGGIYKKWKKAVSLTVDEEYNYNTSIYKGDNFKNIFQPGNAEKVFHTGFITEGLMRGFRGKWGSGMGEEKTGVLQTLSRLSYTDFMSHCRRVILNFDTTMKMARPRQLHTSQYGYFCTSETPTGASIGITKNMSIMTAISTAVHTHDFLEWLKNRGGVLQCNDTTQDQRMTDVPVYVNGGSFGYTDKPELLRDVVRMFKRTGCLPYSVSIVFSARSRSILIYMDDGRPMRPLIWLEKGGRGYSVDKMKVMKSWRTLVMGTLPARESADLESIDFMDPFPESLSLEDYVEKLVPFAGCIEYVDPYEQNETFIANYPEYIRPETTHVEVHPSTILSMMTSMIPFPHHNQSPRNQLSCSQSKQGVSIYATNWRNRFDNSANILCYGEMPISRTLYTNYLAEGKLPYGMNCILALACWRGYNQEDGIVISQDALQRGMFMTSNFRSYVAYEEDDALSKTRTRIGNPAHVAAWLNLKQGLDYSKLDADGIVKEGELVDENTVIVGAYMADENGKIKDASTTPQVWTRGRVEKIVVTVNNKGLRLVKVRVTQHRVPELGDKFCLTPDHEVLTERGGWVPIAEVTVADKVCTLCNNKNIKYVHPTDTHVFHCDNEFLYSIRTDDVDLKTTLNHRMFVKKDGQKKFGAYYAKDICGKRVTYKRDGRNMNSIYTFSLPLLDDIGVIMSTTMSTPKMMADRKMDPTAWPEFFGYWFSNGGISESVGGETDWCIIVPKYVIIHIDSEPFSKKTEMHINHLCMELGLNIIKRIPNSTGIKLVIEDMQLAAYLDTCMNTNFPEWIWELSQVQCRAMIRGLIDNNLFAKVYPSQYYDNCYVCYNSDTADHVQRLFFHAGWYGKIESKKCPVTRMPFKAVHLIKGDKSPVVDAIDKIYDPECTFIEEIVPYSGDVHCLTVPDHVFYVRRNGKAVWTCNSNRHGQKGTIGMAIRASDMPRTKDGIVPDMIMNPHAIPSRMTMGQNLEQLLGKTAALSGMVGDATAFMNDGNPADQYGGLLEKMGFEKYGNEILYNGSTGEQIASSIFIGPVYGMRLKHMTEDKMQARGKGRREQRTHQPTGGRGNQGGLKIGEMDRDAILSHGVASFFRESFMARSDGTSLSICSSCGTIPIYNPKLDIAICPLCDGPVQFVGDTAKNFEILPPIGKPKSNIIHVEMPYATKLLGQELETYLNVGLRYITSADTMRFQSIPSADPEAGEKAAASETVEVRPIVVPTANPPMEIPLVQDNVVSVEELQTMERGVSLLGESMNRERELVEFEAMSASAVAGSASSAVGLETIQEVNTIVMPQSVPQYPPVDEYGGVEEWKEGMEFRRGDTDENMEPAFILQQSEQVPANNKEKRTDDVKIGGNSSHVIVVNKLDY